MKKKKNMLKIIIPMVIIIFIALALVFGNKQNGETANVVKSTEIVSENISAFVNSTGVVLSKDSYEVSPKVTGEVIAIHVKEGELVTKGQVLCELDQVDISNQIRETEIQLEIAKENLVQIVNQGSNNFKSAYKNALLNKEATLKSYNDAKSLLDAGVYSQSTVDSAYTTYVQAANNYEEVRGKYNNENSASEIRIQELRIESLENSLEIQRKQLANTVIVSPADGVVTSSTAKLLTYVNVGTPIFIIENLENLKVEINVSQYDIHKVGIGQKVTIKAEGIDDVSFEGNVSEIGSRAVNKVLRASQEMVIEVAVDINTENTNLKPNYSARTEIEVAAVKDVMVLPYETIYIEKDGTTIVYTIEEGIAKAHIIEKGVEGILNFEVISDTLKLADRVILNPTEAIADGAEVVEMDVK